jgi:hypothetical protein
MAFPFVSAVVASLATGISISVARKRQSGAVTRGEGDSWGWWVARVICILPVALMLLYPVLVFIAYMTGAMP